MTVQGDVCHRIGGGQVANLGLRRQEASLIPPGISVLIGGTPEKAAANWRIAFPRSGPSAKASVVGVAEIENIRELGFDVIAMPTPNFPNHGRLIHPTEGEAEFTPENLQRLSNAFTDRIGL